MDSWRGDFSWARVTKATKGWPSGFIHFKDALIANTALPKITGAAKVGSTLTASAGSWNVSGVTLATSGWPTARRSAARPPPPWP